MAKQRFEYGNLTVEVNDIGDGVAPWDEKQETRHEYDITVKGPSGARYKSKGWGSLNDYQKGEHDHRAMAWNVLNDLYSSAADPDEWINLVIGEASGREALDKGKLAEKIIKAAKKFDLDDLQSAYEKAQEEGA